MKYVRADFVIFGDDITVFDDLDSGWLISNYSRSACIDSGNLTRELTRENKEIRDD